MNALCFLAVLSIGTIIYGAPSVWFASEGGIGFALIRGAEVTGTYFVSDYSATSFCHCRRLCYVTPRCNGVSYTEADTKHCRTFKGGFYGNTFELKDNTTLLLRNTTTHWFHIGVDGRIYLVLGGQFDLTIAAYMCNKIPGFHLGVYKDMKSTKALQEIHETFGYDDVAVAMRFNNPSAIWSDNTPFEQQIYKVDTSGSGSYLMLQSQEFKRTGGGTKANVVCQADLQNGKH